MDKKFDAEKITGYSQKALDDLKTVSATEMGRAMVEIKSELDEISKKKSKLEKQFSHIRKVLPEKMQYEGIDKFSIDGKNINYRTEIYASISVNNREEAYEWLKNNGFGDLIKPTVNAMTLKGFVKEQLEEGQTLPDNISVTLTPMCRFY